MLLICQAGYETLLARELESHGLTAREQGPGWVLSDSGERKAESGKLKAERLESRVEN